MKTRRDHILAAAGTAAREFVYYGRRECADLPLGEIEAAIEAEEIELDEIVEAFREDLEEWGGLS